MSTNVKREPDTETNGLKRSHDDFSGDEVTIDHRGLGAGVKQQATEAAVQSGKAVSPAPRMPDRDSMSPLSSPGSLSDLGTITPPPRNSPSPNPTTTTKIPFSLKPTPDANPSSSNPPPSNPAPSANQSAKRKRRTAAEKEAEEREKAQKKKEREEKKEAKQAEKAKADAEKQAKLAEKAKADAEKQAKLDEKRRKKEEEERKIQEDKEKKERAQPKLLSFFKAPATPKKDPAPANVKTESPAKAAATSEPAAPVAKKEERSQYEKLFRPFYVHSTVRLAKNPFEMDQETHEAKTRILGEYFSGKREPTQAGKFDPVDVFQLPSRPAERGRIYPPVRYTVEKMLKLTQNGQIISEEDKKAIMKETTDALRRVPIKYLRFYQDVRPAYRGTVTLRPYQAGKSGMRRLARNPTLRDQVPVNYEHDSEAEWESEGEDVDIEDEDEEDLDDGDGDMDEFLDDSDDNGPARFVSANGLEPESTGLCWEDRKRVGPNRAAYEHRMEFILETPDHHAGIDPFSTKYWEPEPKAKPKSAGRPPKEKTAAESLKPSDAFKAISSPKVGGVQSLPKKMLENNNLQELKKVIEANPKIAKGGLIDLSYVALAHAKVSRSDIKEAIAAVAEKVGGKGQAGSWTIKPGFGV